MEGMKPKLTVLCSNGIAIILFISAVPAQIEYRHFLETQ